MRRSSLFTLIISKMMTVSTLFVIQFFFLFVFWIMFSGYMIFCQPKFLILYDYKIISILFIQFYTLFFFYVLSSFLFPAHKRLIYVNISFRLFRKLYRIEIVFSEVRFPFLKNFGGYTSFCFLNNSGLNFLNSKPFVISVLRDLLIQIDLLGFSPLQFFKVSWKKFLPVSSILISYQIFFWCKASIHILMNLICISKYRSHLHFCSWNLFFPTNRWAEGFTLSGNISLHISWNLCIRCVTVVQYELPILYYLKYWFP